MSSVVKNVKTKELWMRRWTLHSFFYSLAITASTTFYQAYAIRILKYNVDEVGSLTFVNISAIALGNFIGLLLVYRFRGKRVILWKVFALINLLMWSTSGFADLTKVKWLFPFFIGVAQLAGSIGSLAYSDTIADMVLREKSIGVFSKVNVFTTTATLIGLTAGVTIFSVISDVVLAYRIYYTLSFISSLISIAFLLSLWTVTESPSLNVTPKLVASKFKEITRQEDVKHYMLYMLILTFSVNLPSALWNYYLIKVFKGDESWISINSISSTLTSMLGYYIISKLHEKLEPKKVVVASTAFISVLPTMFLFAPSLPQQILFNAYSGFTWAFLNNMINIYNLYLANNDNRIYFLAMLGILNNLTASTATKIGSSIASIGVEYMRAVFIASSLGRLASMFYALKKLDNV